MSAFNATLAYTPPSSSVPGRPDFILCSSTRQNLTNYRLAYEDTIYMELQGTPPYDLSATISRRPDYDACGAAFDLRNSTPKVEGTPTPKVLVSGNSFNYTPSQWAAYGIPAINVGDSIQFFAVEQRNTTPGVWRSFASTNYTLVANRSEAGQWTPPRSSEAGGVKALSIKATAILGLVVTGLCLV